jgi:hypothetical protein
MYYDYEIIGSEDKPKKVVIKIALSDFFDYYKKITKDGKTITPETLQDLEEYFFLNNYGDNYDYITAKQIDEAKPEAINYLLTLPEKYTKKEIAIFDDILTGDIRQALSEAYNQSYQDEYLAKYRKLLQEYIDEDLEDCFKDKVNYKLLDRIDDKDFDFEAKSLCLEVNLADIRRVMAEDDYNDDEVIESFLDYHYYNSSKSFDPKFVDYYGTLGNMDDWMLYFKDYNEIEHTINIHRINEAGKIDNLEAAALNLKPEIDSIADYIDTYIKKEPARTKITRQIEALKSIIKNAV